MEAKLLFELYQAYFYFGLLTFTIFLIFFDALVIENYNKIKKFFKKK